jgi:carbon monoxide dehydrogenase subunit G
MYLSGSHIFEAPQEMVYRVLTDPETLGRTLPGCQKFEDLGEGKFAITLSIGIGPVKGIYNGTVELLNESPPWSYTLRMSAKGGVGFVDGEGDFELATYDESPGKTYLTYKGEAHVGGKVAGLGQRLVEAGANLVIGQFFRALDKEVQRQEQVG